MKAVALGLLLAVAAGGCSRKAKPPCSRAIEGVLDRAMSVDGDVPPQVQSMTLRMGDALTKLCLGDQWDAQVIECLDNAHDTDSAKACAAKLTPVQVTHLNKSLGELMGVPLGDGVKPSTPAR